MAPHVSAELWARRHDDEMVHATAWPTANPDLLVDDTVTLVVQVAGKVRARLEVAADIDEASAVARALDDPAVQSALGGATPSRIVARLPKLVSFVP